MTIEFNANVIKRVRTMGLPTDLLGSVVFILFCLYERNFELLDEFDDYNKDRRILILYRQMRRLQLIDETDETEAIHYTLTQSGIDLVEYIKSEMPETVEVEQLEQVAETETIESWIKDYMFLFPSGMHNGRPMRTNRQDCTDRMKWFINKYGFSKSTILAATATYVKGFAGNYEYMRNSSYFIWKQDKEKGRISDLLTACENYQDEQSAPRKINLELL